MSDFGVVQEDIERCVNTFRACAKVFDENRHRIAKIGGTYFAAAAEAAAPKGTVPHKRYSNGTVVATYAPGNLGRSMQVLDLRRTKNVYVGAKLKGGGKGTFAGARADGYYMHMVERSTVKWDGKPYFNAAWNRSKDRIFAIMANEFRRVGERFIAQQRADNGQLSLF